jgi:type II secretory pathway pseudopilin PulG
MRSERGFTLTELLVTILSVLVVLSAILMITTVALHDQDRIAERVGVNQRVRPVMTRLIDELHSACVAILPTQSQSQGTSLAPVLAGSTATSITFLSKAGSDTDLRPDKHTVTLSGTTLTETTWPGTGGTPPNWTFGSPQYRTLLADVSAPPGGAVFKYYKYSGTQLTQIPVPPTLTATDSSLTVKVDVSFVHSPPGRISQIDPNSPLILSDSASFRLESPNNTGINLPCR